MFIWSPTRPRKFLKVEAWLVMVFASYLPLFYFLLKRLGAAAFYIRYVFYCPGRKKKSTVHDSALIFFVVLKSFAIKKHVYCKGATWDLFTHVPGVVLATNVTSL